MIARRALLGGLMFGGLPARRPDQHIAPARSGMMPAPQQNVVIGRFVIVAGTKGGLFVYSPSVGLGNLIASDAAATGTDPYGNAYLAAITAYANVSGVFYAAQLGQAGAGNPAALAFYTALAAGGPWSIKSDVLGDSTGNLNLSSAVAQINLSAFTFVTVNGAAFSADQLQVVGSIGATLSVFLANRAADPVTPVGGGRIYCKAGALFYRGTSGTVTQIAPA